MFVGSNTGRRVITQFLVKENAAVEAYEGQSGKSPDAYEGMHNGLGGYVSALWTRRRLSYRR